MSVRYAIDTSNVWILLYRLRLLYGCYGSYMSLYGIGLAWYKSLGCHWWLYPTIRVGFIKVLYPSNPTDIVWIALVVYPTGIIAF